MGEDGGTARQPAAGTCGTPPHPDGFRPGSAGPAADPAGGGLLRAGALVAGLAAAGRLMAWARHAAVAATLGAGPVADAFLLAFRVAGFLRALFGGRGAVAAFVPMFARLRAAGGKERARDFAGRVLCLAARALAAAVAVLELAAPWLLAALAPGLDDGTGRLETAAALLRIMLPFALLAALAQLLGGMLNGAGRFAAAAALPALFNAVALLALLVAGDRLATPAHALAWGVAAAGAAQLACTWRACRRAGIAPAVRRPRLTRRLRRLLGRAAPATAGVGAEQAVVLTDLALASLLAAGAVSWLHYAERVARLLPAVAGMAAATVLLPHLARRRPRAETMRDPATARTVEAALLMGLPAAAALAVAAGPVVHVLFGRGAFGAEAVAATAAALACYAGAVPAWMLARTLGAACLARGDALAPMLAAFAAAASNLVLSRLLMEPLGHAGIALGTAGAAWIQALALRHALARRGAFPPDARLRRRVPAIAAASLAMAGAAWAAGRALGADPGAAALAAPAAAGLLAIAVAARLLGAADPGEILRAWRAGARDGG